MVSLAHNETSLVSLMTRKKVYEVKVRTGDAAKYGDNVSENSRTTSKNEVKKKVLLPEQGTPVQHPVTFFFTCIAHNFFFVSGIYAF